MNTKAKIEINKLLNETGILHETKLEPTKDQPYDDELEMVKRANEDILENFSLEEKKNTQKNIFLPQKFHFEGK